MLKDPSKPHSSPASAAPAASYKSPYRTCPGGTRSWSHAAVRRRRICDRGLRFFANPQGNTIPSGLTLKQLFRTGVFTSRQEPKPGGTTKWAVTSEIGEGRQIASWSVGSRLYPGEVVLVAFCRSGPATDQMSFPHLPRRFHQQTPIP